MNIRRLSVLTALLVAVSIFPAVGASAGTEYFLARGGQDSASGTASSPWATFDHALSRLRAGDTLTVRGGTYVERVEHPKLNPGTPSAPITVRAYPGEKPVVKGVLWLNDLDYWYLDGINVTWDPGTGEEDEHMVKLTDGAGWEFVNAEVWGARSFAGILVATSGGSEPTGWRIAGNCVHDTYPTNGTNNDHLIYANSGRNGSGVIEGNLLFNAENGNGVKIGGPSESSGGGSNLTVRNNTIYNTRHSILVSWQSYNNLFERNILDGVSEENNANFNAYELAGTGNRARDNVGHGAKTMFQSESGYRSVADEGGNRFPVDPRFDSTSGCGGFKPTNPEAKAYGHTVVGSVGDAGDSFSDDDDSVFEGDIEKLAAAGITRGCGPGRFCPDDSVTRGEMAAFLVRGLPLP